MVKDLIIIVNMILLDNSISLMLDYSYILVTRKLIMLNLEEFLKIIHGWLYFSKKWLIRIKINLSKMLVNILNLEVVLLIMHKEYLNILIKNMKILNHILLLNKISSLEMKLMIS